MSYFDSVSLLGLLKTNLHTTQETTPLSWIVLQFENRIQSRRIEHRKLVCVLIQYEKCGTNWLTVLKVLQIFDLLLKIADDSVLQPPVAACFGAWQRVLAPR